MAIGFSLAGLKTVLAVRDSGGALWRRVRTLTHSKIRDIDEQITRLVSPRGEMKRLSKAWNKQLRRLVKGPDLKLTS